MPINRRITVEAVIVIMVATAVLAWSLDRLVWLSLKMDLEHQEKEDE
jgi:hypothetical protein